MTDVMPLKRNLFMQGMSAIHRLRARRCEGASMPDRMKSVHALYEKSPFATWAVLPQSALTVLRDPPRARYLSVYYAIDDPP